MLNKQNASRAVIIKTFVTTDLQKAIAENYGLRCVETLTGFKYIGAKLGKYERAIPRTTAAELCRSHRRGNAPAAACSTRPFTFSAAKKATATAARILCATRTATAPAIMFCEVAAYAKSRGQTVDGLLDEIYAKFGYFAEKNGALIFEGAEGAAKIARLVESYGANPS